MSDLTVADLKKILNQLPDHLPLVGKDEFGYVNLKAVEIGRLIDFTADDGTLLDQPVLFLVGSSSYLVDVVDRRVYFPPED